MARLIAHKNKGKKQNSKERDRESTDIVPILFRKELRAWDLLDQSDLGCICAIIKLCLIGFLLSFVLLCPSFWDEVPPWSTFARIGS